MIFIEKVKNFLMNIKVKSYALFLFALAIVIILCTNIFKDTYSRITDINNELQNLSRVEGTTVYVDNRLRDLYYYNSLNYTETGGTLPTGVDQNIYNNSNIVQVTITYSGIDTINGNLRGVVSTTEDYDTYVYYGWYPVKNGKVTIPLIDNPFTKRPTGKGFNSWLSNDVGVRVYLDRDTYERFAEVTPTSNGNGYNELNLSFFANWIDANEGNTSDGWTTVFNGFETAGFHQLQTTEEVCVTPELADIVMDGYYLRHTASRNTTYSGYYVQYGTIYTANNRTCSSYGGCTYYTIINDGSHYTNGTTYYRRNDSNTNFTSVNTNYIREHATVCHDEYLYTSTDIMAGYYSPTSVAKNDSIDGLYDSNGNFVSGTCNTNGGCNNYYEFLNKYDSDGNINYFDTNRTYYYYITRDLNIAHLNTTNLTSNWSGSKPFTFTGILANGTQSTNRWTPGGSITISADTTIENMILNGGTGYSYSDLTNTRVITAAYNNLKMGRGLKKYNSNVNFNGVVGGNAGTGSNGNDTRYKIIVESGFYNNMSLTETTSREYYDDNLYIQAEMVYGNDLDRITKNNDNLEVYYEATASWAGNIRSSKEVAVTQTVKSGKFGTSKHDIYTGIYVGGVLNGTYYTARRVNVEGGWIYNLIGGPLTQTSRTNVNDTYIYMTGGDVDIIIGGAGVAASYGHRIISVTGGNIKYSVLGGSNGNVNNTSSTSATLNGSSFIYIGGNAVIGDDTLTGNDTSLFGVEYGNVFGNGNGKSSSLGIGSNSNAYIVVNENCTIKNGVYGGGNFAANGVNSSSNTAESKITILGGNINGDVYGGGNQNRVEDYSKTNNVTINMSGGTVGGNIYGGSNISGIVTGSTNINVTGGTVTGNVYGGGKGNTTYVKQNANVTIGELNTTGPTIGGVYGGSALGTVNAYSNPSSLSSYNTHVVVNSGTITNVFGGGQGDNSNTPYVSGNATTDIHGGTITNVFGGNDLKGTPNGTVTVNISGGNITNAYAGGNQTTVTEPYINITGGTITKAFGGGNNGAVTTSHMSITGGTTTNAFGGGNNAGVTTTNVSINGGTVTNAFGGSNASGNVTTSNVTIASGNVTNAYGGNNVGGTTSTSYVTTTGGTIGSVYGGGYSAPVTTSHVQINNGTVTNAFGGGNSAGVTTTDVRVAGGSVTNVFGGSDSSGVVTTSNVIISNGTVTNAFGGNNVGGTTGTTNVTVNGGTVTSVYGGGEQTSVTTIANVTINSPVTNVFGGSDSAGTVEESVVNISSTGNATNVYGGNNLGGTTDVTNVTVNGTATNVYGGGEQTSVTDTANVNINGTATNVFGGSDSAGTVAAAIVNINNGGTTTTIYGGNNLGGTTTTADVNINTGGTATTVYGGGLKAVTGTTDVMVNGTVGNVYGGGNEGNVTGNTTVLVSGATINHNVYGGGNAASVLGSTNVTVTNSSVTDNVFGGGNNGMVIQNATTTLTNANITKSAFAGGNGSTAIVLGNNKINVQGTTTVGEHVFGGGNAAATGCENDIKNINNEVIQACTNPNSSTSIVNIAGATIGGNVYGGANTSVVYGETYVNIGTNTVTDNLTAGNIAITGTVFGGGEANASGSEEYDFNFISVTEGINIKIDGSNHTSFNISGSIFGSGNASSSGGYSYIDIKNYGTFSNPKRNVSIQRTDVVTIDNSAIVLSGAKDRTNKYKNELFTFSRIGHLKLKNGSSLFLEKGANLLESFSSLVDVNNVEQKATVQINDNTGAVTKNVDNRVYMFEGRNLNISDDESLGTFGDVNGMSFFGMYKIDRNGNVATGLYSNQYNNGDNVTGSELYYFSSGSYVVGKHKSAHNIYVDGFYSNFPNEEGTGIDVKYIEPTPSDATYYRWVIGETVETLEVNITASKYATLGTKELQLMDYYHPNTEIYVLGVNYDYLASDVNLLLSENIPRYASDVNDANTNFGLGMKTGTIGWITRGETEFSTQSPDISGTTYYKAENSNAIPSFMFYLYHSKNISVTRSLGTATISLMVVTPINDLSNRIQRINIEVNMDSAFFEGNNYEGTIAPGAQYEMFANANVNITSKSTFSTYFSLYSSSANTIYQAGYKRNLVSTFAYPVNTKITMIDFANSGSPEYYYYIVDQAKYNSSLTDLANDNEVSYPLSNFIRMGSSSTTNTYNDAVANSNYYDSTLHKAEEEFIFIVDLKDTGLNTDALNKTLLLELRDTNNSTVIPVLDVAQQKMFYNLYGNKEANINSTATLSNPTLYIGQSVDLNVITSFSQQTLGNVTIIDTNFYEKKLGIKLSLYNSDDELVNGAGLLGTAFVYNGVRYYPRQDGTVRFNIAESVANVSSRITINAEKSNITSGEYTLVIDTFGSADGIYYGIERTSTIEQPITIVNELYGLDANSSDDDVIVDQITGFSQDGNNNLTYQIDYSSGLRNPSIRISLYRRTYTDVYNYTYSLVDIMDYVSNELEATTEEKVYVLRSLPPARFQHVLYMKDNLITGTYQVRFSLYDGNNYVGHINKYIIIE